MLPTLPRLGGRWNVKYIAPLELTKRFEEYHTPREQVVVYWPFRSQEEVVGWEFMSKIDHYWSPMVPVNGGPGVRGGTEIDFYHPIKQIALFFDGPVHDLPGARDRDEYLRKGISGLGLKVLAFPVISIEQTRTEFPVWYLENIQ